VAIEPKNGALHLSNGRMTTMIRSNIKSEGGSYPDGISSRRLGRWGEDHDDGLKPTCHEPDRMRLLSEVGFRATVRCTTFLAGSWSDLAFWPGRAKS
jgi:hypothetical protein